MFSFFRPKPEEGKPGMILPEGWVWVMFDEERLTRIVPDSKSRGTSLWGVSREEFKEQALSGFGEAQTPGGPWVPAGVAGWSQHAAIDGAETQMHASLVLALGPLAEVPKEGEQMTTGLLGGEPVLRFLYVVPLPQIDMSVALLFATPAVDGAEAAGGLFGNVASTVGAVPIRG